MTHLPNDKTQLRLIHGIGKVRLRRYGKELCRLIQEHRAEQRKNKGQTSEAERKRVRGPSAPSETKCRSFELFQSGKSVDEIAAERQLAPGTIEGHLAHFVRLGELDVDAVLDPESVDAIQQFLTAHPDTGSRKPKPISVTSTVTAS